jgi:cobalt-zinc-cadmium efflux system protein
MLFTPGDLALEEIAESICDIEMVKNVHHIHVWQLSEHETHLEAHVDFREDIALSEFDRIQDEIESLLQNKFGINHVNIQPEFGKADNKERIVQD